MFCYQVFAETNYAKTFDSFWRMLLKCLLATDWGHLGDHFSRIIVNKSKVLGKKWRKHGFNLMKMSFSGWISVDVYHEMSWTRPCVAIGKKNIFHWIKMFFARHFLTLCQVFGKRLFFLIKFLSFYYEWKKVKVWLLVSRRK